jgi:hypothetical protein
MGTPPPSYMPYLPPLIVGGFGIIVVIMTQSWMTHRDYAKRRLDVAEEVLALFYETEEAIRVLKSPFGFMADGRQPERESDTAANVSTGPASIVEQQYQMREGVFNNLRSKKYRFRATFRGDTGEPFELIEAALTKILTAARMLRNFYWPKLSQDRLGASTFVNNAQREQFLRDMKIQEDIIYSGDGADEISEQVAQAVRMVEAITAKAAKDYASGLAGWLAAYKAYVDGRFQA